MSGWLGKIYGQREAPVAADILIERLQDSHKVEDRRKTISELKSSISKESHGVRAFLFIYVCSHFFICFHQFPLLQAIIHICIIVAILYLKSLQIIGKAIPVFVGLLKSDRGDIDIIRDTLEILIAIMTCSTTVRASSLYYITT